MTASRRVAGAMLAIACAVGLAGCGSGSDGKDVAAAAVSQTFLNLSTPAEKLTTSQAACFGTGIIDAFGVDHAVEYGFLTKDHKPVKSLRLTLPSKDAGTYADLYLRCANPSSTIKAALIAKIAPKTTAAEQQLRACLDRTLTNALLRKALVAGASGDSTDATLTPLFTACGRLG